MKVDGKEIQPVFVIGHGRSGTNLVGEVLRRHHEVHATIEEESWFWLFAEIAFNPAKNMKKVPEAIRRQKSNLESKCDKPVWVDKTHPLVLLREVVEEYYPEARLIHVVRNPFDVYCSATQHEGVMQWFKRHNEVFGKGINTFLGTDENIEKQYHSLRNTEKIAYRWRSWVQQGLKWEKESTNVITCFYERLVENPETFLTIADFIGIERNTVWHRQIESIVRKGSVNRYKRDMSRSELNEMSVVLKEFLNKHKQLQHYRFTLASL